MVELLERPEATRIVLKLAHLTDDPDIQPRLDGLDAAHVAALAEAGPDAWPPVAVVERDGSYVLIDGRHRVEAIRRLNLGTIACEIRPEPEGGDLRGLAFALNKGHGSPLTSADRKAEAGRLLRTSGGDLSDAALSRRCGLSDKAVAAVRAGLAATSEIPRLEQRTGADGKRRPATQPKKAAGAASSANGSGAGSRPLAPAQKQSTHTSTRDDAELVRLRRLTDELTDYLDERGWLDDGAMDDLANAIIIATKERQSPTHLRQVAALLAIAAEAYRRAAGRLGSIKTVAGEGVAA